MSLKDAARKCGMGLTQVRPGSCLSGAGDALRVSTTTFASPRFASLTHLPHAPPVQAAVPQAEHRPLAAPQAPVDPAPHRRHGGGCRPQRHRRRASAAAGLGGRAAGHPGALPRPGAIARVLTPPSPHRRPPWRPRLARPRRSWTCTAAGSRSRSCRCVAACGVRGERTLTIDTLVRPAAGSQQPEVLRDLQRAAAARPQPLRVMVYTHEFSHSCTSHNRLGKKRRDAHTSEPLSAFVHYRIVKLRIQNDRASDRHPRG